MRARLLTPDRVETSVERRGFTCDDPGARELLETVGSSFLDGYSAAAAAGSNAELEATLEQIPTRFRGFAYEGAGMGAAVVDALPLTGGHLDALLAGRGDDHIYMVYVGVGWAMARLPRFLWPGTRGYAPLVRWLVLDGWGFHQAYFHTAEWVHAQRRPSTRGWPGWDDGDRYGVRAIDQGIGRALWFVAGTDPNRAVDLLERFPADRHRDLWAGIGLAATYAGGTDDPARLDVLRERAGEHLGSLLQGSAFAAEARVRAGLVVPHVRAVTAQLCGRTPEDAAELVIGLRPQEPAPGTDDPDVPEFERWRMAIGSELASVGEVHA